MGKLFNFLFIFSVFLVAAYSLPKNDTRLATAKKRSEGSRTTIINSAVDQVVSTITDYLKNLFFSYGSIKIVVWNKSQVPEIGNAKWKAKELDIEAPLIRAIEQGQEPAILVARFSRNVFKDISEKVSKTVWISYSSYATGRICIYTKIELSTYAKTPTFSYNVYPGHDGTCDPPRRLFDLVMKNNENEYKTLVLTRGARFIAECAAVANDINYVLNVYIKSYSSRLSVVSLNQNTDSYQDSATEMPVGNF